MRLFVLLAVWLVILVFLPLPLPGALGYYNPVSRMWWCVDESSCLHERAHYIDFANGKISSSDEYLTALVLYVFVEQNDLAIQIVGWAGLPRLELYAWIYSYVGGDVPLSLREFYPEPTGVHFRSIPYSGGWLYYAVPDPHN